MIEDLKLLHVLAVGAGKEKEFLKLAQDAKRFNWLEEHTITTALSLWMGGQQFLAEAVDNAMSHGEPLKPL